MHTIGLCIMCISLVACTTTPIFPPEVTKDVETDTLAVKAWKEQTSYPSNIPFVSHKVELEGQIVKVIPKQEGVVILADGIPISEHPSYDSQDIKREDSFRFAIVFNEFLDPDMLQTGNRLVVVGKTDRAGPEAIGWMQKVLPHLLGQCLHIWKIDQSELKRFPYGDSPGRYPQEERTFCPEKNKGRLMSASGG